MSGLFQLVFLTAAFTPLFWVVTLVALGFLKRQGLTESGLPADLLEQIEQYAWGPGVVLGLTLAGLITSCTAR